MIIVHNFYYWHYYYLNFLLNVMQLTDANRRILSFIQQLQLYNAATSPTLSE